jgi:hypothetical protein
MVAAVEPSTLAIGALTTTSILRASSIFRFAILSSCRECFETTRHVDSAKHVDRQNAGAGGRRSLIDSPPDNDDRNPGHYQKKRGKHSIADVSPVLSPTGESFLRSTLKFGHLRATCFRTIRRNLQVWAPDNYNVGTVDTQTL